MRHESHLDDAAAETGNKWSGPFWSQRTNPFTCGCRNKPDRTSRKLVRSTIRNSLRLLKTKTPSSHPFHLTAVSSVPSGLIKRARPPPTETIVGLGSITLPGVSNEKLPTKASSKETPRYRMSPHKDKMSSKIASRPWWYNKSKLKKACTLL